MITFSCPHCGVAFRCPDEKAGRRGKCPKCAGGIQIPFATKADASAAGTAPRPKAPLAATRAAGSSSVWPSLDAASAPSRCGPDIQDQLNRPDGEAAMHAAGGHSLCPSCKKSLPALVRLCARCGIHLPSGRPMLTARILDEDELATKGDRAVRTVSWVVPTGIYPIHSEAVGKVRPYATWAFALITVIVSVWFWCYEWSDSPKMQSMKNLMLWPRHAQVDMARAFYFFEHTSFGDVDAYEAAIKQQAGKYDTKQDIARAAYMSLTPAQRSLGSFSPIQMLTHQFLHGGIMHLASNLLFLLVLGSRVNSAIGNIWMIVLYPLLGIAACGESLFRANAPPIPTIGASGAIMGLAGMYLVLYPVHRVQMVAWIRLGLFTGFRLLYKFFSLRGFWLVLACVALDVVSLALESHDGVAHWAHVSGFAVGVLMASILLIARAVYSGGDIISLIMGRHAWWLLGTPHSRRPTK